MYVDGLSGVSNTHVTDCGDKKRGEWYKELFR